MKTKRVVVQAMFLGMLLTTACQRQAVGDSANAASPSANTPSLHSDTGKDSVRPSDGSLVAVNSSETENSEATAYVVDLSRKIRSHRNSQGSEQADKLMQEFVDTWKPVGKKVTALQLLLGDPHVRTNESVSYRFDGGYGGWEWSFKTAGGVITHLKREGID